MSLEIVNVHLYLCDMTESMWHVNGTCRFTSLEAVGEMQRIWHRWFINSRASTARSLNIHSLSLFLNKELSCSMRYSLFITNSGCTVLEPKERSWCHAAFTFHILIYFVVTCSLRYNDKPTHHRTLAQSIFFFSNGERSRSGRALATAGLGIWAKTTWIFSKATWPGVITWRKKQPLDKSE